MGAEFRIRPYRHEDWDHIAHIHDTARLDELRASVGEEAFLTLAETAEGEGLFAGDVWVADDGQRPLGFVALEEDEVTWLYVDPAVYRGGVGRALLRHAVAAGGEVVETTVLQGNDAALQLYLSEGFVIVETKAGQLAGNERFSATGHIMERRSSSEI